MNKSGIHPFKYKVLVKPVKVEKKSKGGIILTDETQDKEKHTTVKGRVIEYGAIAFTDPDWLDRPKEGQLVMFDRYAGWLEVGKDGEDYRLLEDNEIKGWLEE